MPSVVLGLDIGGANLKAATADKRAASVPFPLWKQPDRLPAALAELVAKFPDAEEFAVTMTGELCDCYETKRQGVNAILTAVQNMSRSYPIRVWSTDGRFLNVEEARTDYLKVAAANWHALATYAGGLVPEGKAILIDIGSTTTDIIPILDGVPVAEGKTDFQRLLTCELVYTGVRRTPVCAVLDGYGAAELFATTLDVYVLLGLTPEDPHDTDTADGRPATRRHAHARLSRILGGDPELTDEDQTLESANAVFRRQLGRVEDGCRRAWMRLDELRPERDPGRRLLQVMLGTTGERRDPPDPEASGLRIPCITSGSGEFLAPRLVLNFASELLSLADRLGPAVAACAPAYALAVLATERRP
jgi:probable H4MPT-linked C1 transfer pathway protein